jgi:hypothetical protein
MNNEERIKRNLEATYLGTQSNDLEKGKKAEIERSEEETIDLIKGKQHPEGTTREWGGSKYTKRNGTWVKEGEKKNPDALVDDTHVGVLSSGRGGKLARTGTILNTAGKTAKVIMDDTDDVEDHEIDDLFNNEGDDDIEKSNEDTLTKGKAHLDGTIKVWGGIEYIKVKGEWVNHKKHKAKSQETSKVDSLVVQVFTDTTDDEYKQMYGATKAENLQKIKEGNPELYKKIVEAQTTSTDKSSQGIKSKESEVSGDIITRDGKSYKKQPNGKYLETRGGLTAKEHEQGISKYPNINYTEHSQKTWHRNQLKGLSDKEFDESELVGKEDSKTQNTSELKEGTSVTYKQLKGGTEIPFKGEVIEVDSDGKYVKVRNTIGDIDYIETSKLSIDTKDK